MIIKESKKIKESVREKETKRIKLGRKNKLLRRQVLYEFVSSIDEDNTTRKFGWGGKKQCDKQADSRSRRGCWLTGIMQAGLIQLKHTV